MHLPPPPGGDSIIVALLFIVAPIVCGGSVFSPCFVMQSVFSVLSSFAFIMTKKRAGCFIFNVFLMSCDC